MPGQRWNGVGARTWRSIGNVPGLALILAQAIGSCPGGCGRSNSVPLSGSIRMSMSGSRLPDTSPDHAPHNDGATARRGPRLVSATCAPHAWASSGVRLIQTSPIIEHKPQSRRTAAGWDVVSHLASVHRLTVKNVFERVPCRRTTLPMNYDYGKNQPSGHPAERELDDRGTGGIRDNDMDRGIGCQPVTIWGRNHWIDTSVAQEARAYVK